MAQPQPELWERIQLYGLTVAGLTDVQAGRLGETRKERLFRDNFGVGSKAVAAAYEALVIPTTAPALVAEPNLYWYLVSIYWLKVYLTEGQMYTHLGRKNPEETRNQIKFYVDQLAAMKGIKIVWRDLTDLPEIFALSVDGVHFWTNEQRKNPDANHCSHKFNHAGVGYEIGILIWHNQVVWAEGPFQPATHDKTKYEEPSGLQSKIPYGKLVIGDRGYRGESEEGGQYRTLSIRNTCDTDDLKEFKRRVRARHENFNCRLEAFAILSTRFRHPIERHQSCFLAVAVLCQFDMENGHPLMDV